MYPFLPKSPLVVTATGSKPRPCYQSESKSADLQGPNDLDLGLKGDCIEKKDSKSLVGWTTVVGYLFPSCRQAIELGTAWHR